MQMSLENEVDAQENWVCGAIEWNGRSKYREIGINER